MKIRVIADSLGYRPDPLLSHLMFHLRSRRQPKALHNIAFLHWPKDRYSEAILNGACEQAEHQGYHLDVILMGKNAPSQRVLNRMLFARGIAGLVLGPSPDQDMRTMLEWNEFAVVMTCHTAIGPNFHRVVPNHHSAVKIAVEGLVERGFKRIGLIVPSGVEEQINSVHRVAFTCLAHQRKAEPLLCPFDPELHPLTDLSSWYRVNKPDALVLAGPLSYDKVICGAIGREEANNLALVSLVHQAQEAIPMMIDYRPRTLGALAVDQLINQLHRSERGIPKIQQTLSVEGELILPGST